MRVCVCSFVSQWKLSEVAVNTRFHEIGESKSFPLHRWQRSRTGRPSLFSFKKKIPVNGSCLCSHNSLERLVFIGWDACNNMGGINVLMHSSLFFRTNCGSSAGVISATLFSPQGSGQTKNRVEHRASTPARANDLTQFPPGNEHEAQLWVQKSQLGEEKTMLKYEGSEQITPFGRIAGVRGFDSWTSGWRRKYVEIKRMAVIENRRGGGGDSEASRAQRRGRGPALLPLLVIIKEGGGERFRVFCFVLDSSLSQSKTWAERHPEDGTRRRSSPCRGPAQMRRCRTALGVRMSSEHPLAATFLPSHYRFHVGCCELC